jgi:hypothetical protein
VGRTPASLGRVGFTRRHQGRLPFAAVIGVTWVIGIFGLQRDRISSVQIPIIFVVGLLVWACLAGIKRSVAGRRDRVVPTPVDHPRPSVTVHWFGEERSRREHPSGAEARPGPPQLRLVTNEVLPSRPTAPRDGGPLGYIPLNRA